MFFNGFSRFSRWNDPWLVQVVSNLIDSLKTARKSVEIAIAWDRVWWSFNPFLWGSFKLLSTLGLSKSHRISSILWSSFNGFTAVKNTDCLSILRLPPGINPPLIVECTSTCFRCGRCTRWSHPAIAHCLAMQNQREYLLNVPGLFGKMFGRNEGSNSTDAFSTVLLLLPDKKSNRSLSIAKHHRTFTLLHKNRQIVLLHHLFEKLMDGWCRSHHIIAFDTQKQSWRNLSKLMSIHFLSQIRIEVGNSFTTSFSRGCPFARSLTVTLCSHFPKELVSDVPDYIFLRSVHNSNPTSCSVSKQRLNQDFSTVTFLMVTDLHIQDHAD